MVAMPEETLLAIFRLSPVETDRVIQGWVFRRVWSTAVSTR